MIRVGVRELRQNFFKHLTEVKQGETLVVIEGDVEVARLSPPESPLAVQSDRKPAKGRPSIEVLQEMREERL